MLDKYHYFLSTNYYFNDLPMPVATAKSNSDGRFEVESPEGEYAIAAAAKRTVFNLEEKYYWFIKVTVTPKQTNSILLSNDNMTTGSSPESLISTREE